MGACDLPSRGSQIVRRRLSVARDCFKSDGLEPIGCTFRRCVRYEDWGGRRMSGRSRYLARQFDRRWSSPLGQLVLRITQHGLRAVVRLTNRCGSGWSAFLERDLVSFIHGPIRGTPPSKRMSLLLWGALDLSEKGVEPITGYFVPRAHRSPWYASHSPIQHVPDQSSEAVQYGKHTVKRLLTTARVTSRCPASARVREHRHVAQL